VRNGPFLLLRATLVFARTGYSLFSRVKHGKALFWGGFAASAVVAVVLQLKGI